MESDGKEEKANEVKENEGERKKESEDETAEGCPSLEEELRNLLQTIGDRTPTETPASPQRADPDISECSHGSVIERVTTYREQISCHCDCKDKRKKETAPDLDAVVSEEDEGSGIPPLEKHVVYQNPEASGFSPHIGMPPPCQHIVNRYHSNIVGVRPFHRRTQTEEGMFSGSRVLGNIFRRNKTEKGTSKGELAYERLKEESGTTVVGETGGPALYKAKIKRGPPHRFAFDLYSEGNKGKYYKSHKYSDAGMEARYRDVNCEMPEACDDNESYFNKFNKHLETPKTHSVGCMSENLFTTCRLHMDQGTATKDHHYMYNIDASQQPSRTRDLSKDNRGFARMAAGTTQTEKKSVKDFGATTFKGADSNGKDGNNTVIKGMGKFYDNVLNCEYTVMNRLPSRYEVYTFDHQNAKYLRTTDCPFPLYTEMTIEKSDEYATRFWAELFGVAHICMAFITSFVLQLFKFLLVGLIRPLMIGLIQLMSDYAIKPLLTTLFNGIIQPVFIFLHNIARSFRDLCLPIARGIGHFVTQLARVLKAIRILDVNTKTTNGPFYQPQKHVNV